MERRGHGDRGDKGSEDRVMRDYKKGRQWEENRVVKGGKGT